MYKPTNRLWAPSHRSRQVRSRVDVYSNGQLAPGGYNAPFINGQVTDEYAIGTRRSLTLQVPNIWLQWKDLPKLEVRPWRGFTWGLEEELLPLGVFPITLDTTTVPRTDLQVVAKDYWSWVENDNFVENRGAFYWANRAETIAYLIYEVGLGYPEIAAGAVARGYQTAAGVWDKTRQETIVDLCQSASTTAYFNRLGVPVVEDDKPGPLGKVLHDREDGTAITVIKKSPLDNVKNVISAYSSNADVVFAAYQAVVSDPNSPANPKRIGRRVERFASPLFQNRGQAIQAAHTLLAKKSQIVETYEIDCVCDSSFDSGDAFTLQMNNLPTRNVWLTKLQTPLKAGNQKLTAVGM